jgi:hypothetical protein
LLQIEISLQLVGARQKRLLGEKARAVSEWVSNERAFVQ